MRGRKAKPEALNKLAGNPGKRPPRKSPQPKIEIPAMPDHLHGEAVAEWERVTPLLQSLGLLAKLDRSTLAAYCMAWARWVEAEDKLREGGLIVKSPNGYPIQNPYLSVANQAAKQMQSFATEFGLSPAARSRLDIKESNSSERNDFASFIQSSLN